MTILQETPNEAAHTGDVRSVQPHLGYSSVNVALLHWTGKPISNCTSAVKVPFSPSGTRHERLQVKPHPYSMVNSSITLPLASVTVTLGSSSRVYISAPSPVTINTESPG